jgi:hypothetical protein
MSLRRRHSPSTLARLADDGLTAPLFIVDVQPTFPIPLVCGIQADTCVLAAGFTLFDAGLHLTLLKWLIVGSSLDPSGELGARLWRHHFGRVLERREELDLSASRES